MKGYWIARIDVDDPEAYGAYVEAARPAFAQFGAVFLARGGRTQAVEGQGRARNVVIAFPTFQAAVDCYASATYQDACRHRRAVSAGEIVIVEGVAE